MLLLPLAQNIALLVALAVLQQYLVRRVRPGTGVHMVLSGLLFGSVAVLGMTMPVTLTPGVIFDGRSVVLSIAGLFGGPGVAALAALMAGAYRLWLGGAGATVGLLVIAEAAAAGVALHYLRRRDSRVVRPIALFSFGLVVHVGMLALFLALPDGVATVRRLAPTVLLVYPVATLLVCRLMLDQEERLAGEAAVRELNQSLERLVDERTHELQAANEELMATSEELQSANDHLLEANEAKSLFLRSMSHELRTPLNSVIGFSDLMSRGLAGDTTDEQRRQLEMINRSGRHLLALINEILDLSRLEAGAVQARFEPFGVEELARDVVESTRSDAEAKGLELRLDLPRGDFTFTSDDQKVRQILLNLVVNAIKFTSSGTVTLSVDHSGTGMVSFAVTDTGRGIPADELESVFAEFAQAGGHDEHQDGAGMGLAISRRLAELMGGLLQVESRVGEGSTFTLLLPEQARIQD